MKKIILTASAIALIPVAAQAQLLGGLGGGAGGSIGGTVDSTVGTSIGSTIDRTTRTVRGTVDGSASTSGDQSVDARNGRVSTNRNANGSVVASTASLADLPVPSMASANGSGSASGQGSANAQLIGTDAVTGAVAPVAGQARNLAGSAAGRARSTARGVANSAPMPGLPAVGGSASGEGSAQGSGSASLIGSPLAVAGSAASAGQDTASVTPGMPVIAPNGASLGTVRQVVADSRGQVQEVVVQQGRVTRTLPAGMFSASGNALVAGSAEGQASSGERAPAEGGEAN
ncbi:hypothetical protein [Erythrobacter litoralis]|uniref:PRC-barrel domain-containing protein n=1 Tax=Erythrobacter litoralis (strain HTCC2594) TaxID=314225 RepID=Q2NC85_ERYLH|nr:hypothetical protein [Erythrobacter litoralis]ABC62706.1 hypothetical protein ELI_03070 [Erythrobacter litoralis HTCC2594]